MTRGGDTLRSAMAPGTSQDRGSPSHAPATPREALDFAAQTAYHGASSSGLRLIHTLDPFSDAPDPARYVPREATERALERLLECAVQPDRPAALMAPPGHGKTLLLH